MGEDLHTLVVGIDEAGRGPIIGDMIIAFAVIRLQDIGRLERLGVMDSKELKPSRRIMLFHKLLSLLYMYLTLNISPLLIDKCNMNKLTMKEILEGLKIISKIIPRNTYDSIHVYIDEVKGTSRILEREIHGIFHGKNLKFVMEEGADKKYPVVSAASIIAKYQRDLVLKPISRLYGEIGSGYPSDPRTREWLRRISHNLHDPPLFVRRSWSTLKNINPNWFKPKRRISDKTILDYFHNK